MKLKLSPLRKKIIRLLAAFIIISGAGLLYHFHFFPAQKIKTSYNRSQNGAWLAHKWFSKEQSDENIKALCSRLKKLECDRIYVHVGPLDHEANIPEYSPEIWKANRDRIKEEIPQLLIFAWLGGINETRYGKADDTLNMKNDSLMKAIADRSSKILETGFDGIHYDIEPLPDEDAGFLKLLEYTRENIGEKPLSVATPHIFASDFVTGSLKKLSKNKLALWSSSYFKKIAKRCDEIAVMSYDSINPTPASYKKFMKYQVKNLAKVVEGTDCKIIMGIPTYEEKTWSHNPKAEKISYALEGINSGLSSLKNREAFLGVAVYALWTTDESEIADYEKLWLRKSP